jgi:hypothetical protein
MELKDAIRLVDVKEFSDVLCHHFERFWYVRQWFGNDRLFLQFVQSMSLHAIFIDPKGLAELVLRYRMGAKYRAFHVAFRNGDIPAATVLEADFYRMKRVVNPETKAGQAQRKRGRECLKEILHAVRAADRYRKEQTSKPKSDFIRPGDLAHLSYGSGRIDKRQEAVSGSK